ncbi:MAG: hypothetical protein L3K02_08525, partial [Thermoplasmata archaeon]|nr:hypothetical protein [Thermoplasmata archaeon]
GGPVPGNSTWSATYEVPGTTLLTLRMTDSGGGVLSATGAVHALPPVPPSSLGVRLNATRFSGDAPFTVSARATVTGGQAPYTLSWQNDSSSPFAPGGLVWNATYSTAGTYPLTVSVRDRAGNVSEAVATVFVAFPFSVSLNESARAGVAPFDVSVRAVLTGGGPPYSISWQDESGGAFQSGGDYWNVTYPLAGNYSLTVSASDGNGEVGSAAMTIHVLPAPAPSSGSQSVLPFWALATIVVVVAFVLAAGIAVGWRRRTGSTPAEVPTLTGTPLVTTFSGAPAPELTPSADLPEVPEVADAAPGTLSRSTPDPVETGPPSAPSPTLSTRILLHLFSLGPIGPTHLAPVGRTQEGIAAVLGKQQGSFARVLLRMEESGLIGRELRHVTGKTRRMQVYYLTDRGFEFARELRQSASKPGSPNRSPLVRK